MKKNLGIDYPIRSTNDPGINTTKTTEQNVKVKLINLLLTVQGERMFNTTFGVNLHDFIFEKMIESDLIQGIKTAIILSVKKWCPEVTINEEKMEVILQKGNNGDFTNVINVRIPYIINNNALLSDTLEINYQI